MAQKLRVLAAFLLNLILFPAPTSGDVKSTVSPVTGDQIHTPIHMADIPNTLKVKCPFKKNRFLHNKGSKQTDYKIGKK